MWLQIYPSEAISAGIATAIRPTAAVAVSSDVLKAFRIFFSFLQTWLDCYCKYLYYL